MAPPSRTPEELDHELRQLAGAVHTLILNCRRRRCQGRWPAAAAHVRQVRAVPACAARIARPATPPGRATNCPAGSGRLQPVRRILVRRVATQAFTNRTAGPVARHLLVGLIHVVAGATAHAWPTPTVLGLVLIVASWAVAGGLLQVYAGLRAVPGNSVWVTNYVRMERPCAPSDGKGSPPEAHRRKPPQAECRGWPDESAAAFGVSTTLRLSGRPRGACPGRFSAALSARE